MNKYQILICDDEQEIIDLLSLYFDAEIYDIHSANDGKRALEILESEPIDLALIDIMVPSINGLELIQKVRDRLEIPLIIISALDRLQDKLKGYEIGADDYIAKPFEPMEVLAKVKSRLKSKKSEEVIEQNGVLLDTIRCQLEVNGERMDLTKVEFEVLQLLMSEPMRVFTKEQIYSAGWDEEYLFNDNSIRVIINRIRSMVGEEHIETIRGIGYRWK
ncbi:response regulator transcription factor [Guggenheimella bovis]